MPADPAVRPAPTPKTRRALFQVAAVAAAAAGGAGLLSHGHPALAAPFNTDTTNNATDRTRLASTVADNSVDQVAFEVENTGMGTRAVAVRGIVKAATKDVSDETAVVGISGPGGQGVYGYSASGTGVKAEVDVGIALEAIGNGTSAAISAVGDFILAGPASLALGSDASHTYGTSAVRHRTSQSSAVVPYGGAAALVGVDVTGEAAAAGTVGAVASSPAVFIVPIRPAGIFGYAAVPDGVGVWARSDSGESLHVEGTSTFTGSATFNGQVITSGPGSKFVGNGLGLSALNASFLTIGTVPDARLSTNVPLKSAASNAFTGALAAASLAGNGAGVTGLNAANVATGVLDPVHIPGLDASKLTSGRLADKRIGRNIPRRNAKLVPFSGKVSAAQFTGKHGAPPAFSSAGAVLVPAGKRTVSVRAGGVSTKAHVLALFQSDAGHGVMVEHVEKVRGGFRAVLTAPAAKPATLAFFVVGQP